MRTKKQASRVSIVEPIIYKPILASLINLLGLVGLTYLAYYCVAYPIIQNNNEYNEATSYKASRREELNLNLPESQTPYTKYSEPLENFYFTVYPEKIQALYNSAYSKNWTINHIYSVNVLSLPSDPTPTSYSTHYFTYVLNSDGSVDQDARAIMKTDLTSQGLDDVRDLYQNAYEKLGNLLSALDNKYMLSVSTSYAYEASSRLISLVFATSIIYLLLPLIFKNGVSLGEKIIHLAYAKKSGYRLNYFQVMAKAILIYIPVALSLYYLNVYTIVLSCVFLPFINFMVQLLSSSKTSLIDKMVFITPLDAKESDLYSCADEEEEVLSTSIPVYKERDYTGKLGSQDSFKTPDNLLNTESPVNPVVHKGDRK